jgi:hypothetical protein
VSIKVKIENELHEKRLVELDYNVGALQVIKILKDCGILSVSEYLHHQTIEEDVQGIIADIIDLDTSGELLTEVIIATRTSILINTQFHQCFIQYTADVIERPDLIKHEFIASTSSFLSPQDSWELIASRFLTELIEQEVVLNLNLVEVFSNQKSWNEKYTEEKFKLVNEILGRISKNHNEEVVKFVVKQFQTEKNNNWFYLLMIVRLIDSCAKGLNDVKSKRVPGIFSSH